MKTRKSLFYGAVAIAALAAAAVVLLVLPAADSKTEFLVPQFAYLSLDSSPQDDDRVAVFVLSAFVGGGCDSASDLHVRETYTSEELLVDIVGYDFTKGRGRICADVLLESRRRVLVDMDWLRRPVANEVVFNLSSKENRYQITYHQCRVSIAPIEVWNVLSRESGSGYGEQDAAALSMTLYAADQCPD